MKCNLRVRSRIKILLVEMMLKYDMYAALPEKPWLPNSVLLGCTNTRPFSWLKYLINRASGSSSTAPDMELAYFLSGYWILAICGAKADAIRARISNGSRWAALEDASAFHGVAMPISESAV